MTCHLTIFLCFIVFQLKHLDAVKFSFETFADVTTILNDGKQKLEALSAKAKTPLYGPCWSRAIFSLENSCRHLTEESQSAMALRFTDCFLQMSGHGAILCSVPRQECLKELSDRAFNAYTEFYTHTQNICYFLQSKLWHEEAEKTIDKLASTSLKVSSQLAEAERAQVLLLNQQRESLHLQENLGSTLKSSKETIEILLDDVKKSTIEQKMAMVSLFEQLATLQSWMIGEISWFDSVFFYCTSSLVVFLFTSTERTRRARLYLYIILSSNYLLERYFAKAFADNIEKIPIFAIADDLSSAVWLFRKLALTLCVVVIFIFALSYYDYNFLNNRLLLDIKKQNDELLHHLKRSKNEIVNTKLFNSTKGVLNLGNDFSNSVERDLMSPKTYAAQIHETGSCRKFSNHLHDKTIRRSVDIDSNCSGSSNCELIKSDHSIRRSLRLQKIPI